MSPNASPERAAFVDLHTHSTASDGILPPEKVIEAAHRCGLAAIALTDHDTINGIPAARAAGERLGVRVIDQMIEECRRIDHGLVAGRGDRAEPETADIGQEADAKPAALRDDADIPGETGRIAQLLLACRDEIRHPDPPIAVSTGFFFVAAACRDKILFGESPHPASLVVSDHQLAAELSRALFAYLTADIVRHQR